MKLKNVAKIRIIFPSRKIERRPTEQVQNYFLLFRRNERYKLYLKWDQKTFLKNLKKEFTYIIAAWSLELCGFGKDTLKIKVGNMKIEMPPTQLLAEIEMK